MSIFRQSRTCLNRLDTTIPSGSASAVGLLLDRDPHRVNAAILQRRCQQPGAGFEAAALRTQVEVPF